MPIDNQSNRQRNGQFNNKQNEKENQRIFQEEVNEISRWVTGRGPTPDILHSPLLLSLYVSSILGNVVVQGEAPKKRQAMIGETPDLKQAPHDHRAVFEAETTVEVKQQGMRPEMLYALASNSTVDTTLISPALPENSTAIFPLQLPVHPQNMTIDLVDIVHDWSLNIHKKAHQIAEVYDCTTNKTVSSLPKLRFWESPDHTQAHFKTVCKVAIAESQEINQQRIAHPNNIQQFSFKRNSDGSSENQFSFEDSAVKLKNIFRQAYEKTVNQTSQQTTGNTTNTRPEEADFFGGLTNAFTTFFRQFDQPIYTEKQESLNGDSVISRFLDKVARSMIYEKEADYPGKSSINTNIPPSFQSTEFSSEASILTKEEVGFATQFWQLFSKLDEIVTDFIKKRDPLTIRGAEARPINDPRFNNRGGEGSKAVTENQPVPSNKKASDSSKLAVARKIAEDIEQNRVPAERYQEPLPNFFYDLSLYRNKHKTEDVINKLKVFLVKQKVLDRTASDMEVITALENWAGIRHKNDISQDSSKNQFAAYLIRRYYGLKNVRLGDALTTAQLQATFMQLKANVHLENYTYEDKSKPIQFSEKETPVGSYYRTETMVCNQIFADFLNDVAATVPKNQTITSIIYNRDLFNDREKTEKVNQEMTKFAQTQDSTLKDPTPSELVRWMRKWLFKTQKYEEIVSREALAAKELLTAFGSNMTILGTNDARAVILQWENNNAQVGYNYKDTTIDAISPDTLKDKSDRTEEQKVLSFLKENRIVPTNETTSVVEEGTKPSIFSEREEVIDKRIVAFLKTKGIVCDPTKPQAFVDKVSNWTMLEGANQKVVDPVKLKQIAQAMLGEENNGLISNEEAELTFTGWLEKKIEKQDLEKQDVTSVPDKQPKIENLSLKDKENILISQQVFEKMKEHLRENKIVIDHTTKEEIISGLAKWFVENKEKGEIRPEKFQAVATIILKESKLYGGAEDELISDYNAKKTVMKWVLETVLGSSIDAYAAKKIIDHPNPASFTIGQLRKSFSLNELVKDGQLTLHKYSDPSKQREFESKIGYLWNVSLDQILPNYFLQSSEMPDDLLISNYRSLLHLVGSRILAASGILKKFEQKEVRTLGQLFFESVSERGVKDIEEYNHLLLPALFTTAQLDAPALRTAMAEGNYKEVAISMFIGYFQRGYFAIMEHQEEVNRFYGGYQTAVINFRRKQALVKEVLKECERLGIRIPPLAGEIYLAGGNPCPGPWIPRSIEPWYRELTSDVAESYHLFNRKLISLSVHSIGQAELDFMFSPETRIYEGKAEFRDEAALASKPIGSLPSLLIAKRKETRDDLILTQKQTDIFVAIRGNEERVYALKRLDKDGGYTVYRVDRDPLLFLKNDLIDLKSLWWKKYRKEGEKVRIGDYSYSFMLQINQDNQLSHGDQREDLCNLISMKHKDALYTQLYESGNDQTMASKTWNVVSHIIPFYDCVVGIINKDTESAAFNCSIDAILAFPVLGQISSMSARFALGLARVLARGGLTGLVKNSAKIMPKLSEVRSLLMSGVRYIDPGIDLAIGGGRIVIHNLVKLKNLPAITKNIQFKQVLEKLEIHVRAEPVPQLSKSTIEARLPGNGPQVLVKKIKNDLYVKVSDYKKGDVYGRYFTLRGDQLREFEGSVSFTEREKELIDSVKIELQPDETIFKKMNYYPKGYGEGAVMDILKNGMRQQKTAIEMNGKLVPVRTQVIEKHGARYDVLAGNHVLPVNYNGIEWYFEGEISPRLHEAVGRNLAKWQSHYEALTDPATLSAPDAKGLMWSKEGRSYIKFQNRYIPLVLVDKETNQYQLVKKDIFLEKTILRFDPEINQFRFETDLEKKIVERPEGMLMAGGFDEGASTSRGSRGGAGSAQTALVYQTINNPLYPPYLWLPRSPNRWQEWKARMNAIEITDLSINYRAESNQVVLPRLTKFIPIERKKIMTNEAETLKSITQGIQHCLPDDLKNKVRVYVGLDANKMPEHLKQFQKTLAKEYTVSLEILDNVIKECKKMLKLKQISSTERGTYLSNMFVLYGKPEEQAVLREVVKRLLTIAERNKLFLQQSADWGFKNILIASTDFQKDPVTQVFYSANKQRSSTYGFVIRQDAENRIIIMADSFNKNPNVWPEAELAPPVSETLLHEASHLSSMANDIISYGMAARGFRKRGKDAQIDFFSRYFKDFGSDGFYKFGYAVADDLKIEGLSMMTVFENLGKDPMLFANYLMTDAEYVATLLRDIAYGYSFEQAILRQKRSTDEPIEKLGDGNFLISMSLVASGDFATIGRHIELEVTKETTLGSTLESTATTTAFSVPVDMQSGNNTEMHLDQPQEMKPPQHPRMKRSDLNLQEGEVSLGPAKNSRLEQANPSTGVSKPTSPNPSLLQSFTTLVNKGIGRSKAQNVSQTKRQKQKKLVGLNI
ncbi:QWxxN domain [Enterococcus sp. DIV1298c]|uniref:QWxxN domain n=1 Tax=Enterococcus sp. DIV1298c TaxID=2815328 RepID=UPI001A918669|nr:QWxxN domain [Enterococcus sp. DIV1298c]MBO0461727.1 QWxxN domain [Enterococcus sp. DIV1298c]